MHSAFRYLGIVVVAVSLAAGAGVWFASVNGLFTRNGLHVDLPASGRVFHVPAAVVFLAILALFAVGIWMAVNFGASRPASGQTEVDHSNFRA
jgi:hypothetical protein